MTTDVPVVATPWQALGAGPLRLLASPWPWRSLVYLSIGPPIAVAWFVATAAFTIVGVIGALLIVGLPLLLAVPLAGMPLGVIERARLRLIEPSPSPYPSPHQSVDRAGLWRWLVFRTQEAVTWREFAYGLLFAIGGVVDLVVVLGTAGMVVLPLSAPVLRVLVLEEVVHLHVPNLVDSGVAVIAGPLVGLGALATLPYVVTAYAGARAALARTLLTASTAEEVDGRVVELVASRARIVSAFDDERRRIERDLHDGVQQRLTALIMTLGLARVEASDAAPTVRGLVATAQDQARQTLTELRDLVRGIHPSVLSDRGLHAALASLADRSSVPVHVDVDLPDPVPEAVEVAAYFIVAEALANVAKHSQARHATVTAHHRHGGLVLRVTDDGVGGADQSRGSGIAGLADRVAVLGGTVRLSSPPGGPTVVHAEIPCAS